MQESQHISKSNPTLYTYIERIINHNQVGFISGMPVWLNIQKSIDVIQHIDRLKKEISHDLINRCWKSILQNQTPIHGKSSQQTNKGELPGFKTKVQKPCS